MEERNAGDIWAEASQLIRLEISDMSYDTWVKDLRPVIVYENTFVLETAVPFYKNFVLERYQVLIAGAVSKVAGANLAVSVLLPTEVDELLSKMGGIAGAAGPLNRKYTFDTFVVGASNRFAHAASLAVAELPGDAYNPLFIYGGVGLGKTHLMHAIGQHILKGRPQANIRYVTSETFTNELIRAITINKNQDFRNKFRNVDVLMVDDIQFIGGKEQTQEEFFHTFNALHEAGKQIVISSDKQPKDIPSLEDRLRSRFEWGLIADIQKPDLETRIAILRRKAELENYSVPEDVNEYIAQIVESNIRELEGCLTRVCAYATLERQPVTLELAKKIILARPMTPVLTPETVCGSVCDYFGVTQGDLIGKKRNRDIVLPRQIAMFLMRELADMSLPSIGSFFGGRDHTTAMHACNKIRTGMQDDLALSNAVDDLRKRLLEA